MAAKVPSSQIKPLDISVDKPVRRRRTKAKRSTGRYLTNIPARFQWVNSIDINYGLKIGPKFGPKSQIENWQIGRPGQA